jgi:hypothetical protein
MFCKQACSHIFEHRNEALTRYWPLPCFLLRRIREDAAERALAAPDLEHGSEPRPSSSSSSTLVQALCIAAASSAKINAAVRKQRNDRAARPSPLTIHCAFGQAICDVIVVGSCDVSKRQISPASGIAQSTESAYSF